MRLIGKVVQLNNDRLRVDIDNGTIDTDLIGQEVVLEVKKYKQKRSLSANGYFWQLVGEISNKLGTDRTTIYKWLIKEAGVSVPMLVKEDAIPTLQKEFRLVEPIGQYDDMVEVICYFGTSTYDTAEFAHLLTVTKEQAIDIGCDVYTDEEIQALLEGIK